MLIKPHGKKMQILLHMAAWIILLGPLFYNSYRWDVPREFVWGFYINALIGGLIFYLNYLILIPKLFFRGHTLRFYFATVILATGLFFISLFAGNHISERFVKDREMQHIERNTADERAKEPPHERRKGLFRLPMGPMYAYNFALNAFIYTIFAMGLRILERHDSIEKRQKELEKEKLNSELAFLKNQISPHFFFNTLNNIYSLIGINTRDSQEAVLKLSRLMRYLLYESERGEAKLNSEIEFMTNYIDLMRLRVSEKVKLDVAFPKEYENITLPPLLFISIIENAFKHGISYREKSFIDISMDVSKEIITFSCKNSLVTKANGETTGSNAGIGLENLRKRLFLIFPDRYVLTISKTESVFYVVVRIYLTKNLSDDQNHSH
jgi:two-component system, LytTR family, sensor kinase